MAGAEYAFTIAARTLRRETLGAFLEMMGEAMALDGPPPTSRQGLWNGGLTSLSSTYVGPKPSSRLAHRRRDGRINWQN
jgi:hypothetical protein